MKLNRVVNKQVADKKYHRWTVVIPPKVIRALGWQEGAELEFAIHRGELLLRASTAPEVGPHLDVSEPSKMAAEMAGA